MSKVKLCQRLIYHLAFFKAADGFRGNLNMGYEYKVLIEINLSHAPGEGCLSLVAELVWQSISPITVKVIIWLFLHDKLNPR